jgi:segregation and condensation protein A
MLTFHLDGVVKSRADDMADFDGPLDLILHLLSKNKVEIKDIQISSLLEQYLEWMARREELNLEIASEFVTMAAHLVYIKSRMLLSIEDEEAMSELELLIASLEERQRSENYGKIKSVVNQFQQRYQVGQDYIVKVPEYIPVDKTYRYAHDKEDMYRAIRAVLDRVGNKLPPPMAAFDGIVGREPYPVSDKARAILERLVQFGVTRFRSLFKSSRSRSEVVATFLAILELCKANRIHLAGTAEDCTVTNTDENIDSELDVTVDSY